MKLLSLFVVVLLTFSGFVSSVPIDKRFSLQMNVGSMIQSVVQSLIPRPYKTTNIAFSKGKLLDIYHGIPEDDENENTETNVDAAVTTEAAVATEATATTEAAEATTTVVAEPTTTTTTTETNVNKKKLKPVNIFIFGGGFVMGTKALNTGIGEFLMNRGEQGHVAVIPNYVLFPNGLMEDMIEDVYEAIVWVKENIEQYGGDPENINIIGHSAGAHLLSMVMLKSALGIENKGKILTLPENTMNSVVLLNGVYDFDEYFYENDIEELCGNSTIYENILKLFMQTQNVSPTDMLRVLNDKTLSIQAKKVTVIHTSEDQTVPPDCSDAFYRHMSRTLVNPEIISYSLIPGVHSEISGAMFRNETLAYETLDGVLY